MQDIKIFKPTLEDVEDIYKLVDFYARKGEILKRTKENITERIREFSCAKVDGKLIGIVSLRLFYPSLAEIRTLAIDEKYQGMGLGTKLVRTSIEEARKLKVKYIFALTFKRDFFVKIGFNVIDKKELPSEKIWEDCVNCPLFPNCGEEAVFLRL